MKSNYSAPGETGRKQVFFGISLEPSTMAGILQKFPLFRNNAICNNVDGPADDHAKEVSQRQINTVYRIYVDSKKMIQLN